MKHKMSLFGAVLLVCAFSVFVQPKARAAEKEPVAQGVLVTGGLEASSSKPATIKNTPDPKGRFYQGASTDYAEVR
jgi:hypothetical protein